MGILKFIIVGAAVGYGINYITKRNSDGRSIVDDIADRAPEWFDKAKEFAENAIDKAGKTAQEVTANL